MKVKKTNAKKGCALYFSIKKSGRDFFSFQLAGFSTARPARAARRGAPPDMQFSGRLAAAEGLGGSGGGDVQLAAAGVERGWVEGEAGGGFGDEAGGGDFAFGLHWHCAVVEGGAHGRSAGWEGHASGG